MVEIPRVLAVDPGPHTGLAYWEGRPSGEVFKAWEFDDEHNGLVTGLAVEQEIKKGIDFLVCESFTINAGTAKKSTAGSQQTIETIGIIHWLAYTHAVPLVLQSPGDAVSFTTKQKLLTLGWWTVGADHARSATKHLVLYLAANNLIARERLIP